ncbi:unnamed protein product [Victoria cruziana]
MRTGMNYGTMGSLFIIVASLTNITSCLGTETDIECLKSLKESLGDPSNSLASWNFQMMSEGFICNFVGVECWHPNENRVLNIKLASMSLQGQFPRGLKSCTSMTGLDLSDNQLSGPLPADISSYVGFLTTLDLSKNNFSGEIPDNINNCTYLSEVKLDGNQFSGEIPAGIGQLSRLRTFSVSGNRLEGKIPPSLSDQPAANFADNQGLCGPPLSNCPKPHRRTDSRAIGVIIFIFLLLIVLLMLICSFVFLSYIN